MAGKLMDAYHLQMTPSLLGCHRPSTPSPGLAALPRLARSPNPNPAASGRRHQILTATLPTPPDTTLMATKDALLVGSWILKF